ncbi:hypothetical protein VTN00DRAFT_3623 [Thermoascus crustaceus]|uniref:uncharacterized protein n=1 Tax=Thermoascus crustaceus TaxID=5088 RepID=UPI0037429492
MRFERGALNPNPGGTGHFMGESGIEAAARRGLERRKREQAEQAWTAAANNDAISQTTTIVGDVEKGKGEEGSLFKRTSTTTTDVEESGPSSGSGKDGNNNNNNNSDNLNRKRSSWRSMKDKIFGK